MKNEAIHTTPDYDEIINLDYIKIPQDFTNSNVSKSKVIKALKFYKTHGYFDKPVTIIAETNERGMPNRLLLVDGLSMYVAACWLKQTEIPVKYISYDEYFKQKEYETNKELNIPKKPIVRKFNEYDDADGNRGELVTYIECPNCGCEISGESDRCECGQLLDIDE